MIKLTGLIAPPPLQLYSRLPWFFGLFFLPGIEHIEKVWKILSYTLVPINKHWCTNSLVPLQTSNALNLNHELPRKKESQTCDLNPMSWRNEKRCYSSVLDCTTCEVFLVELSDETAKSYNSARGFRLLGRVLQFEAGSGNKA